MAWIRSDCAKLSDEWYLTTLNPAERNAFDLFVLRVKAEGARGSVACTGTAILASQWFMDEATVASMLKKSDGKITKKDGRWYVTNWRKYQEDYRETTYEHQSASSGKTGDDTDATTPPHTTLPHKNTSIDVSKVEKTAWFEEAWSKYPNKQGKSQAYRHYLASVKTHAESQQAIVAMQNYLRCERVAKGFIQNGSTWFNQWRDWISPTPEMMGKKPRSQPIAKREAPQLSSVRYTCSECRGVHRGDEVCPKSQASKVVDGIGDRFSAKQVTDKNAAYVCPRGCGKVHSPQYLCGAKE